MSGYKKKIYLDDSDQAEWSENRWLAQFAHIEEDGKMLIDFWRGVLCLPFGFREHLEHKKNQLSQWRARFSSENWRSKIKDIARVSDAKFIHGKSFSVRISILSLLILRHHRCRSSTLSSHCMCLRSRQQVESREENERKRKSSFSRANKGGTLCT